MIDLTKAINCIRVQKENHTYQGAKVGRITKDCSGRATHYSEGRIVLFTEQLSPSNAELRMGEYMGMEQRPTGNVTLEMPLDQHEIDQRKAKGSLITTIGTMVNVSKEYVEEIVI
jgi:hypothetical protein